MIRNSDGDFGFWILEPTFRPLKSRIRDLATECPQGSGLEGCGISHELIGLASELAASA